MSHLGNIRHYWVKTPLIVSVGIRVVQALLDDRCMMVDVLSVYV